MITGIDGSGFAGLPLTGSLAGALGPTVGLDVVTLCGCRADGLGLDRRRHLIAWSSLIAVAGFARVPVLAARQVASASGAGWSRRIDDLRSGVLELAKEEVPMADDRNLKMGTRARVRPDRKIPELYRRRMVGGPSRRIFRRRQPADTSDIVGRFQASCAEDAEAAVARLPRHSTGWKKTSVTVRARILNRAADYLEANVDRFAAETDAGTGQGDQSEQGRNPALGPDAALLAVEGQSFTGETFPNDDTDMVVYTNASLLAWCR